MTYNVTAPISDAAVRLTSTGRLERVRINANNLSHQGVHGPGTVKDVDVRDAIYAGFFGVKRFEGATYSANAQTNFRLTGTGVTSAPDALMRSYNCDWLGFYLGPLYDSRFEGAIASTNCGLTSKAQNATGIETWEETRNTYFNIIISRADPGYGLAIYREGTASNFIREFYGDASGSAVDSDPGISIGGGAHNNTIQKATVKNFSIGVIMGEDVSPPPHHNTVHALRAENTFWGCVFLDRGAYSNVVGDAGGTTCINTGGADSTHTSSIWIANRSGIDPSQEGIVPPHDNQVMGLSQSGTDWIPPYAVYLGPGTSGNSVVGSASSWRIARLVDESITGSVRLN